MGKLLIVSGRILASVAAISASRGSGVENVLTNDPKEVWTDAAVGSAANIDIDLGAVRPISTVALCGLYDAAAGATWTISGGASGYAETTLKASGALRAVDGAVVNNPTHALWNGATFNIRYLRISLVQPGGEPVLKLGRVIAGSGFTPTFNKEWGAGRGIVDTGTATRLPSGGIATVEGARFGSYAWTLGDLTDVEVETLYGLQRAHGETLPLLVVEDPDATYGQAERIHYGCLVSLRRFERRSPGRTRWEFTVEEWI